MDVGVAFYIDAHAPPRSNAWCSVNGGDVELKEHPASNPNVFWVTNVDMSAFIEWDIGGNHFKRNDFLSGGLMSLLSDLGVNAQDAATKGHGVAVACEIVKRALQKVIQAGLSSDVYALQKLGDAGKSYVAIDAMQEREEQSHASVFIDAFKTRYMSDDPAVVTSSMRLPLHFPRGLYAHHIANRPLPSGKFNDAQFNKSVPALQTLRELSGKETGFARLKAAKSHIKDLKLMHFSANQGQWFALPEAHEIAKLINVKIDRVIVSEQQIYPLAGLISKVSDGMRIPLMTTSVGLLLHSSWEYLASQRLMRADNSHAFPSSQAAYIRAWDRISCYRAAKPLSENGAHIVSYGHGAVQIMIPRKEASKHLVYAFEHGMTTTLSAFRRDEHLEHAFKRVRTAS